MRHLLVFCLLLMCSLKVHGQDSLLSAKYLQKFLDVEFVDTSAMKSYSDSAIFFAERFEDPYLLSVAYRYKGWCLQDLGRHFEAEQYFVESLNQIKLTNNKQGIADAYGNLGISYTDQFKHIKALDCQLQSLRINEELLLEDLDSIAYQKAWEGKSYALSNISGIYGGLKDFKKALVYQRLSLNMELEKMPRSYRDIAVSYHSMAISQKSLQRNDSALYYCEIASANYAKVDNKKGMAMVAHTKGRTLQQLERYKESLEPLKYAMDNAFERGDLSNSLICANAYAHSLLKSEEYVLADSIVNLLQSKTPEDDVRSKMNLYHLRSTLFEVQNQNDSALFFYKKYQWLKDSIFDAEKYNRILENQLHHDYSLQQYKDSLKHEQIMELSQLQLENAEELAKTERKSKIYLLIGAICLLALAVYLFYSGVSRKRLNKKLVSQQEELTQSLKEREVLLKEIHHRVKNNLQIVSSLLSLQGGYSNKHSSEEMLKLSQNRIHSMALIHEKLYQTNTLDSINFKEYLDNLASHLSMSFGTHERGIDIQVKSDEVVVDIDRLVPCGLVVNELVTNSIKHAFPEKNGGLIEIICERTNEGCEITVRDNGLGMPKDFNLNTSGSLGMRLATGLCKQLKSQLNFYSEKGSTFSFTFTAAHV